jgi:aminoglycoside phosphotransferase (APT) family kinase protein
LTADPVAPALVDDRRLAAYLAARLGHAPDLSIEGYAASGSSNVTAFLTVDGARWVLRRPPGGALLPTAHDMVREYRFVSALQGSRVPVPRAVLVCEDPDVLGAPFYIAERVDGAVLQDGVPDGFSDPAEVATLSHQSVDTLAAIHDVDWRPLDLPYRPGQYLQRQVRRWSGQLAHTPTAPRLVGLDRVTQWILAHCPEAAEETIVHGDYGLHNMIIEPPPRTRIAGVLDWEMATIGDPLADLAWFLSGWGRLDHDGSMRNPANAITLWPGAATADQLLGRYQGATGRAMDNWAFYDVFTQWKGIIIIEGLYSAHVSGSAANPAVQRFETETPRHLAQLLGSDALR